MTTSTPLSAPLLAFAEGSPDVATAKALTLTRGEGLALVAHLAERKARGHLEALGEVASEKEVKKAARAAAFKLKQQGVDAAPVARVAAVDLSVKAELDRVAIVSAPGLDGHLWMVIAALPGAGGGELDVRDPERGPRLDVVEDLALGRVRRAHAEMAANMRLQTPVLADAGLVVRMVDAARGDLEQAPKWSHFQAWRDRAVKLGADAGAWDARAKLGPAGSPIPKEAIDVLAQHPIVGFFAPPSVALERIDADLRPLLHGQEEMDKGAFVAKFQELTDAAAASWCADEAARRRAAGWLDATADVLFFHGDHDAARIALALADELRAWNPAGGAHPLVAYAFATNIDIEAAWSHREAHVRGEAHH
ncbi:MAG: hypothetical protein IT385_16160 [Deltaproteobacteria bacterium]|nr:hypothetical protein [Deltaproteobacteria bacterium]